MVQYHFKFRLYVAGDATNSAAAKANLKAICHKHLLERHEIEIIDVYAAPDRALEDGIFLTPTLVKQSPPPVCR
jgi:circadian clock protein KaiB